MRILNEGVPAPLFSAPMRDGTPVRLADYRGMKNVVLFFYPKDFTPGCTREVCAYRDSHAAFEELEAVVFGISYDDARSHRRFSECYDLPFPLLTDVDHSISRKYGVARLNGLFPLVRRVTFVIDKEGIIRKVIHHEMTINRHVEDAIAVLKSLPSGSARAR